MEGLLSTGPTPSSSDLVLILVSRKCCVHQRNLYIERGWPKAALSLQYKYSGVIQPQWLSPASHKLWTETCEEQEFVLYAHIGTN